MENDRRISVGKKAALYLLVLFSLGVMGCSGAGKAVPEDKQILFSETAKNKGIYSSGKCTVDYSYRLDGENMSLGGSASYRGGYDSMDVRVLFVDGAGSVLDQKLLYSSGYRAGGSRKSGRGFEENLVVPPGAAGISFTCSVRERRGHK